MNLNKFIELTKQNEGCTLSFNTGVFNPNYGYMASHKASEFTIKLNDFNLDSLLQFIVRNQNQLQKHSNFLGSWLHNDLVYLDVSKQFINEQDCKQFAVENEQLAYFDLSKQELITI